MQQVHRHVRTAALCAALLCSLCTLAQSAAGGDGPALPPGQVPALAPAEAELAEVLRRARSQDDLPFEVFVVQVAQVGADGIRPSLVLLERERVPALRADQAEQQLSEPQREILLAGLAHQEPVAVLKALDERLTLASDRSARLLALRVLGAVGIAATIEHLGPLALVQGEEEPPPGLEDALREAVARILRNAPEAFDRLPQVLRSSPPALHAALISAAGDSGDPRALALLANALAFRPELAPLATAQVLRVGRSPRLELNKALIERLRWLLDSDQPGLCRSVVLALGELRDCDSIPLLIDLVDSSDTGLAQNAVWALQRATGLTFGASSERWRHWYAQETAWFAHEERAVLRDLAARNPAKVSQALREIGRRRTRRDELAVEVLEVLERAEPNLRAQACDTLGQLDCELALPALVERLERDIPYCSQAAWRALGAICGLDLPAEGRAWREALALDA